jgi:hypothetical protein
MSRGYLLSFQLQDTAINLVAVVAGSETPKAPGEAVTFLVRVRNSGVGRQTYVAPGAALTVLVTILSRPSDDTELTGAGVNLPAGWTARNVNGMTHMLVLEYRGGAEGTLLDLSAPIDLPVKLLCGSATGVVPVSVQVDADQAIWETDEGDNTTNAVFMIVSSFLHRSSACGNKRSTSRRSAD